jgi:hypothetical protein
MQLKDPELSKLRDALDRPLVEDTLREEIDAAFAGVQGRGALIALADTNGARLTLAARLGEEGRWKVAGGAGVSWHGRIDGRVMVMGVW